MHLSFRKIIFVASIFATTSAPYAMENDNEKIGTIVKLINQSPDPQEISKTLEEVGLNQKNLTSFKNDHSEEIKEFLKKE